MTAASYATNLVTIVNDTQTNSATNWSALGGGGAALNPGSTENFIQNAQAMSKDAFGTARKGFIYDTGSDQGGSGTDGAYSFWVTFSSPPSLDTKAGAGLDVLIGSSSSAYEHYHVHGSDTFPFGGWLFCAVNEATAGDETTGSPTAGVEQTFGILCDATATGAPSKGETTFLDTVREGRHDIVITNGTAPDAAATFDGVMSSLETSANRYGMLVQKEPGGPFDNSGLIQFGTSGTAVRFIDSDKVIFLRDHDHVTANFHTWEVNNASSVVTITNFVVKALGTTSPGRWLTNADATVTLTTCQFIDMGTFQFDANTTASVCTFNGCDTVTANEADLAGCSFLVPSVAADGAAVSWDETITGAHTISELDNTTFSMGTNNHHAISFSTNVSNGADITLTGIEFTGFDADGTGDSDNSILEFLATTGTITVNLIGCTVDGANASSSNFTFDTRAGCTVTATFDPKTTKITCEDQSGTVIENVRVLLETADNGGGSGFPYQAGVSTLTQSAGTATLTASSAHGLATNDYVVIRGANIEGYNKQAQITVTGTTTFTYTVDSGLGSPAGGTPVFSYAPISGLTSTLGVIQSSKTWPASQGLKGWARKSTTSPYYKTSPISVADASGGTDLLVLMISDE